ncbi:uncharacterized protein LOC121428565 [Lytechinus variegatus]|uniref:uncharacterized protein LOC121428565 n=1 Tax=Lytechinus variegatus TaxID=7654 RepID=UPI001BB223A3|nr:uncharacterized protein LOC121428565 [Lytechinus variegatus]
MMRVCLLVIVFSVMVLFGFTRGEEMFTDPDGAKCKVPKVELKMLKPGINIQTKRRSERTTGQPMTFEVWYDESVLNSTEKDVVINTTQQTVELISRQLRVKERLKSFIFPRSCETGTYIFNGEVFNCTCGSATCSLATLPEHHLNPCLNCRRDENGTEYDCEPEPGGPEERGINDVHFVLYVTSVNACAEGVIAFAGPCFLGLTFNRPIAGSMNICPDSLRQFAPEVIQQVVQHEIYHAIGVNSGLFAFFRDENGDPLTPLQENGFPEFDSSAGHFKWSERVARTMSLDWDIRGGKTQRNVTILVTPNIVREARQHFGCDSIEGVELEDDGDGSALSHFEARIFTTESMAPQLTVGRKFSRLTLAWLEDTGWYEVDYAYADPYTWGRGLGCGFVNQSCKWWMDTQRERGLSLGPYCEKQSELMCSVDGDTAAICTNTMHNESLPEQYQYFDSFPGVNETDLGKIGGAYNSLEHCPVIYPLISLHTNDYRRQTCDKDINECDSNPCSNGATCMDVITGYFCACHAEYEGRYCEYGKTICTSSDRCERNEVCKDGRCSCGYGRIRTEQGCQIPRRFDMRFELTEINGSPVKYLDFLNTSIGVITEELQYAIYHRLSRWEIFVNSVVSVDIKSFLNGNSVVEADIVLDPNSTSNDVMIYELMTDSNYFAAKDLSVGNSSFTVNVTSIAVQDLDECNETEHSACSVYSACNNSVGSYQCSCLPGFIDQGDSIDGPGTLCIDIDECSDSSLNDCSPFAECTNTPGGYDCVCLSGYTDSTQSDGRICDDINECLSQPCFNDGTCRNFKDMFTCECATGYEGQYCETMMASCENDDQCFTVGHEICSTSGLCTCRLGYLKMNGVCQAIGTYKGSLRFLSINGSPLLYTSALADPSREGFQQLAQQLRGTLLSAISNILDVSFTSFRAGSVIAEFDLVAAVGSTQAAVITAVTGGLGSGTILAGQNIISVDPSSMRIDDQNECNSADQNDCSSLATCINDPGSFSCTCLQGFIDISPAGAGSGRLCERDHVDVTNSESITIIISIVIGVLVVLFIGMILLFVCCIVSTSKLKKAEIPKIHNDVHNDIVVYSTPESQNPPPEQNSLALVKYTREDDNHMVTSEEPQPLSLVAVREHGTGLDTQPKHNHRTPIQDIPNAVYRFEEPLNQNFHLMRDIELGHFGYPGRQRRNLAYPDNYFSLEFPGRHRIGPHYPDRSRLALQNPDHSRLALQYPDRHRLALQYSSHQHPLDYRMALEYPLPNPFATLPPREHRDKYDDRRRHQMYRRQLMLEDGHNFPSLPRIGNHYF